MRFLRIAVAEDDWFLASHLSSELARLGHAVVGLARTGEELVALVGRERPDLALVDVRLARASNGLAAAKKIEERFGVPAVAVTAHLTASEAKSAGLLGLLRKPYTAAGLRALLAQTADWLHDRRAPRPFIVQ